MYQLVIEDDEGKTTSVPLPNSRDEITIGRKEGNTIRLTERNVSRVHARIVRSNGSYFIEDKGSYNGVKVNGDRISGRRHIKEGDEILIGDYHISLQLEKGAGQAASRSEPKANGKAAEAAPMSMVSHSAGGTAIIRLPLDKEKQLRGGEEKTTEKRGRLCLLSGPIAGTIYPLQRDEVMIGRTEDNDIVLNHRSISRNHAKIIIKDGVHQIVDLGSANGVRVNGEEYGKIDLRRGDKIDLGHVRLRFIAPGENFVYDPSMREDVVGAVEDSRRGGGLLVALLLLLVAGGGFGAYQLGLFDSILGGQGATTTTEQPPTSSKEPLVTSSETQAEPSSASVPAVSNPEEAARLKEQAIALAKEKKWDEAIAAAEGAGEVELAKTYRTERDANTALVSCLEARAKKEFDMAMGHCAMIPKESQVGKEFASDIKAVEDEFRSRHVGAANDAIRKALSQKNKRLLNGARDDLRLLETYFGKSDPDVDALTKEIRKAERELGDEASANNTNTNTSENNKTNENNNSGSTTKNPEETAPKASVAELLEQATTASAQKQYSIALDKVKEAKSMAPGNADVYRTEAAIYNAAGNIEKACNSFKRYLKLAPSGSHAAQARSYLQMQNKELYPACEL